MAKMASAAMHGGAVGIRANTVDDIRAIQREVALPVIGIIKSVSSDSAVYITPTMKEADALVEIGADIIAADATNRARPGGVTLERFFAPLRKKYPRIVFMADCATLEDALRARELGFDCIGSTLRGYTEETQGIKLPDLDFIRTLVSRLDLPVIAEGGIWTPEQLVNVFEAGVWAAVVGSAITRPMEITRRYIQALEQWKDRFPL
jgi:N-acylglucosamine-6-phosphate 2-epimerase